MELIEIAKKVEMANSAIEKLGFNQDDQRKPFAITLSVGFMHGPCYQLRKDNSAFFYDYHSLCNALVWTFGTVGRAIIENPDFEVFESDEDTSTFITEFETNDENKERVIVYVNIHDMK